MAQNIIRRLRLEKQIEQGEFAKMLGVSQATVSDWELGKKIPKSANLEKISKIFGVSAMAVLGEEDIKPVDIDDEVWSIRNYVKENPDFRILFDQIRKSKPETTKAAIAFLKYYESGGKDNA